MLFDHGKLYTVGTDGNLKVWSADKGREMLLFPWFVCLQNLRLGCWGTSLCATLLPGVMRYRVFVGTTHGDVRSFSAEGSAADFTEGPTAHLHRNGITRMHFVQSENVLLTVSLDQRTKVVDADTLQASFEAICDDGSGGRPDGSFRGVLWHTWLYPGQPAPSFDQKELITVDDGGHVMVFNPFTNSKIQQQLLSPPGSKDGISDVAMLDSRLERIALCLGQRVEVWRIIREEKLQNFEGHDQPVIAMQLIEDSPVLEEHIVYVLVLLVLLVLLMLTLLPQVHR